MKFELEDFHRNTSDAELLSDVLRVANQLGVNSLTREQYSASGKFALSTLYRHFGNWKKVVELCHLSTSPLQKAAMSIKKASNEPISNQQIIDDLKRVASQLSQTTINSHQYQEYGSFSVSTCSRRFGGWDRALKSAGLMRNKDAPGKHIETNDLLQEIERVWILLGRQPTSTDIKNGISKYSLQSYARRFSGWRGALEAFIEWVNDGSNEEINPAESAPVALPPVPERAVANCATQHMTSRDINLRLRFRVMQRDNFKCCACGASPAKDPAVELHIDHIIPWSKGGETVIDNLQTLCSKCNLGKSDLM